jgi:starch phosphorylase
MLDVMVKRLHEYKRQMLKLLHIVTQYEASCRAASRHPTSCRAPSSSAPRRPGLRMAKRIIHLINAVGEVVNADPRVEGRLKVLFPPNYNVTLAERLIPAADLSEQISLAGKEASGTGNMKFALNGALTIGTDDGANVEIRELVGDDNFFLFGMSEPEVEALWARGYKPAEFYQADENLRRAMDLIASGAFSGGDRACSSRSCRTCSTTTASWCSPTTRRTSPRRPRSTPPTRTRMPGRGRRSSTSRAAASSRPTARCATTSTASGTPRRCSDVDS